MLTKIKASLPLLVLLLISVVVCAVNYTPGTFLSGWDTLHPEFNFGLNFERTLNGVFRVEQGLGAVAGHSHMGDLPRIFILYLAHFILPLSFLRYFYIDLCIVFGALGMYLFLRKTILKANSASFLGALFYLLNIGTVQTFNVPFEMFTTLFATLPFMFLFATEYLLDKPKRRRYLALFAVSMLLNTPSAYAATLWYVFFLCFVVYFFILSLLNHKHDKRSFLHFFVLIGVTLSVNLFWLLPNVYFIVLHGAEVAHANINLLFSDQAFLKNKEFGNLWDILLLKSFYFDWKIYAGNNQFVDLLSPYITYFHNIFISTLAYLMAGGFVLGGILYVRRFKRYSLPAIAVLLICLLFLFNDNFPVSLVYNIFQNHVPFFKEALRFPDDKILNIYTFLVSIFFATFAAHVIEQLNKLHDKYQLDKIFLGITAVLIIIYSLPTFSGNFINYYMRVKIPDQYFQLFDYLNTQPADMRVANFPIESPWGWVYYDWSTINGEQQAQVGSGQKPPPPGYQGAGFLYFGIKQPLLDRDFDRWSPYNESYYREISYAVYKQDPNLLANVLRKYKIGFLFVDKSVVNPGNSSNALYFDQSENLLARTYLIKAKQTFGTIDLYTLNTNTSTVNAVDTNLNVTPNTTSMYQDLTYQQYGNYISLASPTFSYLVYPFRDLIDNQSRVKPGIVSESGNYLVLRPKTTAPYYQAPSLAQSYTTFPASLVAEKTSQGLLLTLKPVSLVLSKVSLSQPLTEILPLSQTTSNLYISVNSDELINLNGLEPNTPHFIQNVNLVNGDNTVSLFDKKDVTVIPDTKGAISPFFSSCNNGPSPTAGILENGIQLNGRGDLCILIPYGFVPKTQGENQTILTDFQFNFTGTANLSSCLYDVTTENCVTYENPEVSSNSYSFSYPVSSSDIPKMALKIFINPQTGGDRTYLLTNLYSWYEKPLSQLNLLKDAVDKMFVNTQTLSFDKIFIPRDNTYASSVNLTAQKFTNDCKAQDVKKEIVNVNGVAVVKYTSVLGSFCDHYSYPNLPHNQGYLVLIGSQNLEGLPLTLCLSDYTSRRCDLYSNLTSFPKSGKDTFLLPPMDDKGLGYDLDFENLGILGSPSVNFLNSIEIVPIPYSFLEQIKYESSTPNTYTGRVIDYKKYAPWLYVAQTSSEPTVLALDESFEPGFVAYRLSCTFGPSCLLKGILAPLFGTKISEHVLLDNWANGWIINQTSQNGQNERIVIIFLPQYLEIFGFFLIFFAFALLLYRLLRRNRN